MSEPPRLPSRASPRKSMGLAVGALVLAGVAAGAWFLVRGSSAVVTAPEPARSAPGAAAAPAAPANPLVAMTSQLLANPATRSLVTAGVRHAIEKQYDGVLDELRFTPDQRNRFVTLLIDGQLEAAEATMKLLAPGLTPAERGALQRQIAAANDASESRVEAFFAQEFPGDKARFEAFQRALDNEPVRSVVDPLKAELAGSPDALTPDKSAALAAAIEEERTKFKFSPEAWETRADPAGAIKSDFLATRARELEGFNEQLLGRTAAILNPAQQTALRRILAGQVETIQRASALSRQLLAP